MSLAICSAVIFRQPAVFVLNSLRPFVHVFLPVGLDASVMPSLATPLGAATGTLRIVFLKIAAAALPCLPILRSPPGHLTAFLTSF